MGACDLFGLDSLSLVIGLSLLAVTGRAGSQRIYLSLSVRQKRLTKFFVYQLSFKEDSLKIITMTK